MADITIDAAVQSIQGRFMGDRAMVAASAAALYVFLADGDTDLKYYKSTDGGQNWAGPTLIGAASASGPIFSVWFDKWTPGDSGTRIHIWWCESTDDDIIYNYLDTSTDTLGTQVVVFAAGSASTSASNQMAGTKARGGNLCVGFDIDGGTETGFYRSTDAGATWAIASNLNEVGTDYYHLFPGNEADTQDIWAVFLDRSANAISLKTFDDSGDSWSEAAIGAMVDADHDTISPMFSGVIRHADNHLILCQWNAHDAATADLKAWDINGAASITALTDVNTDADDCAGVALFIDQSTTDLYAAYLGKADGSETFGTSVGVYYKKSTDDGATWGAETPLAETVTLHLNMLTCDMGGTATRFMPVWFDETNDDLITNYVNSIAIGAVATKAPPPFNVRRSYQNVVRMTR
jgi:hypothetical protein